MKNLGFILAFALLAMTAVIYAGTADDKRDSINTISEAIANLDNKDANIREMSAKALVAQGDAAIPYLRNVLRGKRSMGSAVAFNETINILEKIGTTNAVNELLLVIGDSGKMFGPIVITKPDQRLMSEYPAYAGIVRIGEPAVYCIGLKLIDEDFGRLIIKSLYLRALRQIGGPKAKRVLEEYIKSLESSLKDAKYALQSMETNIVHRATLLPSVANSGSNSVSP